ncbi:MAG: hypothetical protein AAF997_23495, partial [Myxococcota bacterium]
MTGRRVVGVGLLLGVVVFVAWWLASEPPSYLAVGPAVDFGEIDEAIRAVEVDANEMATTLERIPSQAPGHDDIIVREAEGDAFISGMDGFIWRVPLDGSQAERFADVPLMPSGLRRAPDDPNVIYFCASRLYGATHREDERVGLYRLTVDTKKVKPVVTEVADVPAIPAGHRKVYTDDDPSAPTLAGGDPGEANSRALAFCNDLDVSLDGKRIYFTEPIAYEGASMGGGAVGEAITLGDNGRLWRHDLDTGDTRLIADG